MKKIEAMIIDHLLMPCMAVFCACTARYTWHNPFLNMAKTYGYVAVFCILTIVCLYVSYAWSTPDDTPELPWHHDVHTMD